VEEVDEVKELQELLEVVNYALTYFSNLDRVDAARNMTFKVKHSPLQQGLQDARVIVLEMIARRRDKEEEQTAIHGGLDEWPTTVLTPQSST